MPRPSESADDDDLTLAMKLSGLARIDALGLVGRKRFDSSIRYYDESIPQARRFAKGLRAVALGAGVLASLVPLIVSLVFSVWFADRAQQAKDWIGLSAILAIVALGLVGIDRLFGFSSGWMRFMSITLDLRARQSAYLIAWARERHRAGANPDDEHLLVCLDLLATSLSGIDDLVRAETQAWIAEFRGALADLEKGLDLQRSQTSAPSTSDRGAVEVRVATLATLDARKFQVQVGAMAPIERSGSATAVIAGLAAGIVKMTVSATISGKPVSVERAVTVEPSKVSVIDVTWE